jgi:hypothetical protein
VWAFQVAYFGSPRFEARRLVWNVIAVRMSRNRPLVLLAVVHSLPAARRLRVGGSGLV